MLHSLLLLLAVTTFPEVTYAGPPPTPVVIEEIITSPPPPETLDDKVERLSKEYEVNLQVAKDIIRCESQNNAYATGTLAVVGRDIGYWQINTYYHEKNAKNLGYDIYNPEDNLKFGFKLFKEQGVTPWKASKHCWQK